MDYSVALRRSFNQSLTFNLNQVDKDFRPGCAEYLNFDRQLSLSSDTIPLSCVYSSTNNLTISGINVKKDFNGLLSVALRERRISSHHTRFIDYQDCMFL
jgi:hypothetical protein